jgi:tRNA dimethylallyltransferase
MERQVIAIVGPTASGKSRLAHRLAKVLKSQIISADSRLIYKKMDIGTAKPSKTELLELPYHLVDVVEPNQNYSLGNYLEAAEPTLHNLLNCGSVPVIVGGTGFYLRGLLQNLGLPDVKPDLAFRERMSEVSTKELYANLKQLDSTDHWKMHPNDRPRVLRALELTKAGVLGAIKEPHNFTVHWFGLNYLERQTLRANIQERAKMMLASGLIEETQGLIAEYGQLELLEKTIGYAEVLQFLNGQISSKQALVEAITISTSQYAKRQLTWFRANKSIIWLNSEESLNLLLVSCLKALKKE